MIRPRHVAEADLRPLGDFANVFYAERGTGLRLEDSLFDTMYAAEKPEGADVHLLLADFDEAAAGVDVVVGELLLNLADAQPVRNQLAWVDTHLVLPHGAAEI